MRKTYILLAIILTLFVASTVVANSRVIYNGTLTASGSAQSLSGITSKVTGAIIYVDGTISTDGIRWYCGSTAPTATTGLLAKDGQTVNLNSGDQVSQFQFIANSGAGTTKIFYILTGN